MTEPKSRAEALRDLEHVAALALEGDRELAEEELGPDWREGANRTPWSGKIGMEGTTTTDFRRIEPGGLRLPKPATVSTLTRSEVQLPRAVGQVTTITPVNGDLLAGGWVDTSLLPPGRRTFSCGMDVVIHRNRIEQDGANAVYVVEEADLNGLQLYLDADMLPVWPGCQVTVDETRPGPARSRLYICDYELCSRAEPPEARDWLLLISADMQADGAEPFTYCSGACHILAWLQHRDELSEELFEQIRLLLWPEVLSGGPGGGRLQAKEDPG